MVEERGDLFAVTENRFVDYAVCDDVDGRTGKVYGLFADENGNLEYLGAKVGSLGLRATPIPIDIARVNERRKLVELCESKERLKDAAILEDDKEMITEIDSRVRDFFGVVSDELLEELSVEWVVPFLLVCLQEWDYRGHELTRKMSDLGFGATRSAAMYRALRQMEKEGIIISETDRIDRGPANRRYSITDVGEAYLECLANAFAQYQKEMDLISRIYNRQHITEHRGRSTRTSG
jgi:poly-beta-hydroxybutyrate-responsive repressor